MACSSKKTQAALETIILIGGVVILSAAGYFLMKGFLGTSGESTRATMERGSDVAREDLLNLGLQPLSLPRTQWYSAASRFKTSFTLSNTGEESLSATVGLKQAGLSGSGVDLGEFEVGFLDPDSGGYEKLVFSDNTTHFVFETPVVPAGDDLGMVLHYNNSTPYSPITLLDYLVEPPGFVVGNVESFEKTDYSAPSVGILNVSNPSAGAGQTISISILLTDTSLISFVELSVSGEMEEAGNFSTPLLSSEEEEFGVWSVFSTESENGSMQIKPGYESGSVSILLVSPEQGTFSFSVTAGDEWGNTGGGVVTLIISAGGSSPGEAGPPPTGGRLRLAFEGTSISIINTSDGSIWSSPQQIVSDTTFEMSLAQSSEGMYLFAFNKWIGAGVTGIVVVRSMDGTSFDSTATITSGSSVSGPSITEASDGSFWLAYVSSGDVFVHRSVDGFNWTQKSTIDEADYVYMPRLIQDGGGTFRLAYINSTGALKTRSSGDGVTWGSPNTVDSNVMDQTLSFIQDSGGKYWLAFTDSSQAAWLRSSSDFSSWSSPISTTFTVSGDLSLAQDAVGTYWLTYLDNILWSVRIANSTDGSTWNTPTTIVSGTGYRHFLIQDNDPPAPRQSSLMVAYDTSSGIMVQTSSDGESWGSTVTAIPASYYHPSLMQDSSKTYWLAYDDSGGAVYVANSSDGSVWTQVSIVESFDSQRPSIIQDQSGMYWVAHEEYSDIEILNSSDGVNWEHAAWLYAGGGSEMKGTGRSGMVVSFSGSGGDSVSFVGGGGSELDSPSLFQADNGKYWIAYVNDSSIYVMSSNDGFNWGSRAGVSPSGQYPSITGDDTGKLWINYHDDNIYVTSSTDGVSWSDPSMASLTVSGHSSMTFDDDSNIFWIAQMRAMATQVLNSLTGVLWSTPINLTSGGGDTSTSIIVDKGPA